MQSYLYHWPHNLIISGIRAYSLSISVFVLTAVCKDWTWREQVIFFTEAILFKCFSQTAVLATRGKKKEKKPSPSVAWQSIYLYCCLFTLTRNMTSGRLSIVDLSMLQRHTQTYLKQVVSLVCMCNNRQ